MSACRSLCSANKRMVLTDEEILQGIKGVNASLPLSTDSVNSEFRYIGFPGATWFRILSEHEPMLEHVPVSKGQALKKPLY